MYRMFGKRIIDIISAIFLGVGLFPVWIIIVVLVRWRLGSPVLFLQQRPGWHNEPFTVYKFRTMTGERDQDGNLLSDAQRLTSFGRFLRSSSLDELPEILNVLRGEMSFVGPRPLLMQYLSLYTPDQMRRHEVKPGMTGWAQVNGRNALTWEEKFELDVWYVDHHSFWLDIRILLMTIVKIIKRENVNQPGHATIQPFQGT